MDFWAGAGRFAYLALMGGGLTLAAMLGAGGAAALARGMVADADRRRMAGAALGLWAAASAAVLAGSWFVLPDALAPMAAGCALALMRLLAALGFDARAARPRKADFSALLQAGGRPLAAAAAFLIAASVGGSLPGAALCAALFLLPSVALRREGADAARAAGRLTALALLMAALLALLPGRGRALAGLAVAFLASVSLTAGPKALLHLPSALYEAYLPLRAWWIRRRASR